MSRLRRPPGRPRASASEGARAGGAVRRASRRGPGRLATSERAPRLQEPLKWETDLFSVRAPGGRPPTACIGKGQMGSALMGSLQRSPEQRGTAMPFKARAHQSVMRSTAALRGSPVAYGSERDE